VPVGALRICLALLLIGSSLALMQKAGAGIPTVVLAGFPFAVGALCLTAFLRSRTRGTSAELRSLDRPSAPSSRSPDRGRLAADLQAVGRD
jgi:hypothetical protein